jgi:chromosome segregation ATPase
VDLIDGLLQKISDSLDLERSAEDKRVAAHKQARKLLTITLQNAATVLANLQVELASTEDAITRTETGLENTEQRLDNFKQTRADRYEECEEAAHDYSGRREERYPL